MWAGSKSDFTQKFWFLYKWIFDTEQALHCLVLTFQYFHFYFCPSLTLRSIFPQKLDFPTSNSENANGTPVHGGISHSDLRCFWSAPSWISTWRPRVSILSEAHEICHLFAVLTIYVTQHHSHWPRFIQTLVYSEITLYIRDIGRQEGPGFSNCDHETVTNFLRGVMD